MKPKNRKCPCCAAPLNPYGVTIEYCETDDNWVIYYCCEKCNEPTHLMDNLDFKVLEAKG